MAYLDAGRTSAAQDLADEVIRAARNPENPYILALGLHLRGMALHAWEQLDDAEAALDEAAQLTRRADVESWELHHSILLRLALLHFDRKDYKQAETLALKVQKRATAMTLTHDLHDCRASRLLGRIALAQGSVETAVTQLERSVALACEMDDSLERARGYHYLARAKAAQGEDADADRYHTECQDLLSELGNTHQPQILGYVAQQKPESVKEPEASSARAVGGSRSTESSKRITKNALQTSSARSIDSVGESLLNLSEAALRDETLVATSPSEPLLDKPD
jgi:hypothetical protein